MPRFLAVDWDPPKLNVLGVQIGKGKVRVEKSLALPLAQELTASSAAVLGKALKDALGQTGIAPAPVLFSLGRDKVIIKELAIPYVPAHEEPTVVRFQASKELTEAASDVILDYALLASPKAGQSTPVQVVIVRKAVVAAVTALCQTAGLKLHAIVPRPFALVGLLDRKTPATIPLMRGLLLPTEMDEADFCVYSAEHLVWARTLAVDPGLAGEVQKNLVLLATQKHDLPEVQKIETTGIPGLGDLRVPKEPLEAWRDNDAKPENPVAFLGALGLAELTARSVALPVNMAAPKEPKPVVNNVQRRKKFGLVLAAVLVPLAIAGWYWNLSKMQTRIVALQDTKETVDKRWKDLEQERIDVKDLKDWEETTISYLDELYDLAVRFPHDDGLRITRMTAAPLTKAAAMGSHYTARVTIHGTMKKTAQLKQINLVNQFVAAMQKDSRYIRPHGLDSKGTDFNLLVDIAPRPSTKYTETLVAPPRPLSSGGFEVEELPDIAADRNAEEADDE